MKVHNVPLFLFPTLCHEKFFHACHVVICLVVNREANPLVMQMRVKSCNYIPSQSIILGIKEGGRLSQGEVVCPDCVYGNTTFLSFPPQT